MHGFVATVLTHCCYYSAIHLTPTFFVCCYINITHLYITLCLSASDALLQKKDFCWRVRLSDSTLRGSDKWTVHVHEQLDPNCHYSM